MREISIGHQSEYNLKETFTLWTEYLNVIFTPNNARENRRLRY